LCSTLACKKRGTATGIPFVSVEASEDELRGLLKAHHDAIQFAEPDIPMHIPDDVVEESGPSMASGLWHLNRVGAPRAGYTGRGTHIYVMDTGVRSTHQDFGGRVIPTLDTFAFRWPWQPIKECDGDVNCATDSNGHGTHVASSAGGTSYGVAPQSTMYAMKVCCGSGSDVLGGMDWIARNAARPAIMTVSLGRRGTSQTARLAVDRVVEVGIVVTVATGNDNMDTCGFTYGFIPSAISVGATDSTDTRARFSNFGACNNIYAPGAAIFGAWMDSDTGTRTISGTSMATPMVAGASALLLEQDATRSPAKVLELLLQSSATGVIGDMQPGDPNKLLQVA